MPACAKIADFLLAARLLLFFTGEIVSFSLLPFFDFACLSHRFLSFVR